MATVAVEPVAVLLRAARSMFPDFDYLGPGGVLDLQLTGQNVERIRVEVPESFLHLQSVQLTGPGGDQLEPTRVDVSSWYRAYGQNFELQRLLDFDRPSGTVVHTGNDQPAWMDLVFDHPVDVSGLRLRNVNLATASRAMGLRVSLTTADGETSVGYDSAQREGELVRLLGHWARAVSPGPDATAEPPQVDPATLVPLLGKVLTARYEAARAIWSKLKGLSLEQRRQLQVIMNREVLLERDFEWTAHGPRRSFRFWTSDERTRYIRATVQAAKELTELTPYVCFGFGAVLAAVRDGDLIPHDDDLDLIVGFERSQAAKLPEALALIKTEMVKRGYKVTGASVSNCHLHDPAGNRAIDVFVGLFDEDVISWYPGSRGALNRTMMYPVSVGLVGGVEVPLPRNPFQYLERIYGRDWRVPDPAFHHNWSQAEYRDLL